MFRLHRGHTGYVKPGPGATVNWGHPLTRGLQFYMPFCEGGGNPRDLCLSPSNGVWNGVAYWTVNNASGSGRGPASSVGTAANLSNTNYLSAGIPTKLQFTQADSFTILTLITYQGTAAEIWSTDPGGATRSRIDYEITGNKLALTFGNNGGTLGTLTSNLSFSGSNNGLVRHCAGVRDVANTKINLYIDGVLDNSGADASTGTWTVGSSSGAGDWKSRFDSGTSNDWIGLICSIAIWNRALRAEEIQQLYVTPWIMLASGLSVRPAAGVVQEQIPWVDQFDQLIVQ